jgi:uncharacterized protein YigA (DUF484 family)
MKLAFTLSSLRAQRKSQEVIDTISLSSSICTQRSFNALIGKMQDSLPSYFNFEGVGILLVDQNSKFSLLTLGNELYSLTDITHEKKEKD